MARTTEVDKVRELQRTLLPGSKADPERGSTRSTTRSSAGTFWRRAWELVRAIVARPASTDRPSPTSSSTASPSCSTGWRGPEGRQLSLAPCSPGIHPEARQPNEQRPLSIPAVRDRVVQSAVKIVIEPIFEADFLSCSFGFRPKRSAHDALQVLVDESWRGRRWVAESDVSDCFGAIPHSGLMSAVEERICRPPLCEASARDVARWGDGGRSGPA